MLLELAATLWAMPWPRHVRVRRHIDNSDVAAREGGKAAAARPSVPTTAAARRRRGRRRGRAASIIRTTTRKQRRKVPFRPEPRQYHGGSPPEPTRFGGNGRDPAAFPSWVSAIDSYRVIARPRTFPRTRQRCPFSTSSRVKRWATPSPSSGSMASPTYFDRDGGGIQTTIDSFTSAFAEPEVRKKLAAMTFFKHISAEPNAKASLSSLTVSRA